MNVPISIDFTMYAFFKFFLSVVCVPTQYKIISRNNASILNFSILFDGKVNLVGAFERLKYKFLNNFLS